MLYVFADIVVVEEDQIGVIVKSWARNSKGEIVHDVYVQNYNGIKSYPETEIRRYLVRHKELNEEEFSYQNGAVNE
jgi:hypothetical protein